MNDLHESNVTFLFTDIEGSTVLWEQDSEKMRAALYRHDVLVRGAIESSGGRVFKTVGDAFHAAFSSASDALGAALDAQRALISEPWDEECRLKVRIALHTALAEERDGDYLGPPLNRAHRLLLAGHGGQVLLSAAARNAVHDRLPEGVVLRDLGERRLRNLLTPERIFQLLAPGLPEDFPPLNTLDTRRNNLPIQPTPLIGREREIKEIHGLLLREEVRLLTLTGPGGTGKTRLGLQVAADMIDEYGEGAFFVALASSSTPTTAVSTIIQALGVVETGDQGPFERLKEYLSAKEMLLVLDNFEQIVEAGSLVSELLAACPRLKVLVTSRTALRLSGEHQYAVPPLKLPEPHRLPSIERLREYEAVKLFVERASAVKTGFSSTRENTPAVAELCVRLDGLPLAIELAAAHAKLLSPQAMLDQAGNRLKLLKGGARDLPTRQQTLRNTIDWSHDLLERDERVLFGRMAVFAGGCTLEAVEQICAAESDLNALGVVESLLDKSLLRREEGSDGEPRFTMLETIREYARERLEESGESLELGQRYAEHFLALAETAEPELMGPRQVEWMDLLETEHSNIRAALSWSLESGQIEQALRIGGALGWFWYVRGYWSEGSRWLEEGLAKDGVVSTSMRAKALLASGNLLLVQGDLQRAEASLEESLALHRKLEDRRGIVYSLSYLSFVSSQQGDLERASGLLQESLALARESRVSRDIGFVLNDQAALEMFLSHHERATALLEESLTLMREAGDKQCIAAAYGNLGMAALYQGDYERAAASMEQAQVFSEEVGDRGAYWGHVANCGLVALLQEDWGLATTLSKESLIVFREMAFKQAAVECLEVLACAAGTIGDASRAARLLGASEAQREYIGLPMPAIDFEMLQPYLNSARSRLGEKVWEAARGEGRLMFLEEAVEYALAESV